MSRMGSSWSPAATGAPSSRRAETASSAFQRIAREIAAYYLLSAESEPADRDGRTHRIKVSLARPGVTVRARREFVAAKRRDGGQTAHPGRAGRRRPAGAHGGHGPAARGSRPTACVRRSPARCASWWRPTSAARKWSARDHDRLRGHVGFGQSRHQRIRLDDGAVDGQEASGPVHSTIALDLLPGKYRIKLAVVDKTGARAASITASRLR